ncbi:unnamed protein product [Clonostachys rosea f. rosea IK726]|uniref:Uncharacterized protein n=1 Tax=Clonostachys rosea f. rosea IK726 TaxID=1349383 RepID=A0ACA9UEX3_BIOOC|nr:unnamed protein product [Clonostachys rosea f. rosea IK726]
MAAEENKASKEATSTPVAVQERKDEPQSSSFLTDFKQFFIFFRVLFAADPTWLDYCLIVFATITAAAAGVPFPLMGIVFGQLVDDMNGATCAAEGESNADPFSYESSINQKVLLNVYIGIAALVLIYSYIVAWSVISQRLAHRLRSRYVAALLRQPPSFFDVRAAAGEVSSRLHGDITAVQAGTSEKVGVFIVCWSFFITVFVIAFSKQPRLAGMLVSMLPVYLLSVGVGSVFIQKFAKQTETVAAASSIASESLTHISVVQAFGAAERLESKFATYMRDARNAGMKRSAVVAIQSGMLYFVSYAGIALAFWQGSKMIAESVSNAGQNATIGEIYMVVYLLIDACVMLGSLAPILPVLGGATAAYKRLMEDIEAPSPMDGTSEEGDKLTVGSAKSIRFQDVTFEYPARPGQQVLRSVSMEFPAGSYTAIVGLSGSGKSTIAALLDRLYDPVEGKVEIDGHDLRDLNVKNLRSFISFVQQEPSLLDRSLLENIALGLVNSPNPAHQHLKPLLYGPELSKLAVKGREISSSADNITSDPDLKELVDLVIKAAEQADAMSFIERLEDGFGTVVGPRGSLLSGGQRQRIALARALIRDPEILVLDEATSALDSATEKRIQLAVERAATENRAIISIAHRLSTIRNAHNIIVMEAGKVIEQGTYVDLMAREDGAFAGMARLQSVGTLDKDAHSISGDSIDASTLKSDNPGPERLLSMDKGTEVDEPEVEEEKEKKKSKKKKEEPTSKDGELDAPQPLGRTMGRAWKIIRSSTGWIALAIISAIVVGCTFSGSGVIFGFTIGALNPCANTAERILSLGRLYSGLMFMLACVEGFANFFAWSGFGVISEKLLYSVRVLSFRSLVRQDVQWHQSENRSPSGLLAIITRDCTAIGGFSGSTIGTLFAVCVNVLVAIILSHIIAWKIALVCLVVIPIILGAGFMQLHQLARYQERHTEAFSTATSVATEAVQSIRTVAALSLENQFMDSYNHLLAKPRKEMVRASASANIWLAINHTTSTFLNALAYWWGTQLMMKGEYTQTQFLIIFIAMLTASKIWGSMFTLAPEFSRAHIALTRLMAVISIGPDQTLKSADKGPQSDVEATGEAKPHIEKSGQRGGAKITFNNVSFSYPSRPDVPVLDNVSFTIQPNQFCGLVGPSGAGKSTIMNLIQQLYTQTNGVIYMDDADIAKGPASFRDSIALVPQDPSLFQGSIRFNVGLGAPPGTEATDEEIEEACRLANIHDVIMALPDKYDSDCGPSASHLSGGQRQRLAIARALVRRPRLLLLDESTSALDAASEAALQEGLEKAARGTTVLAITHRLHTVRKADVIFVVEGGQIVDKGRHGELMGRRESYRINVMQQMLQ